MPTKIPVELSSTPGIVDGSNAVKYRSCRGRRQ